MSCWGLELTWGRAVAVCRCGLVLVCSSYQMWDALSPGPSFFHFIWYISDWDTEPELRMSCCGFALPNTAMKKNCMLCKTHLGNQVFSKEYYLKFSGWGHCLSPCYLHLKGEHFVKRKQGHLREWSKGDPAIALRCRAAWCWDQETPPISPTAHWRQPISEMQTTPISTMNPLPFAYMRSWRT